VIAAIITPLAYSTRLTCKHQSGYTSALLNNGVLPACISTDHRPDSTPCHDTVCLSQVLLKAVSLDNQPMKACLLRVFVSSWPMMLLFAPMLLKAVGQNLEVPQ
jgi:hypothetical protein